MTITIHFIFAWKSICQCKLKKNVFLRQYKEISSNFLKMIDNGRGEGKLYVTKSVPSPLPWTAYGVIRNVWNETKFGIQFNCFIGYWPVAKAISGSKFHHFLIEGYLHYPYHFYENKITREMFFLFFKKIKDLRFQCSFVFSF